jgi:hypothetical protein
VALVTCRVGVALVGCRVGVALVGCRVGVALVGCRVGVALVACRVGVALVGDRLKINRRFPHVCQQHNFLRVLCTALHCTAAFGRQWPMSGDKTEHKTRRADGTRGLSRGTALHCTVLHCAAKHCTVLHCTALQSTALHCTALHCTALHCTALPILQGRPTARGAAR